MRSETEKPLPKTDVAAQGLPGAVVAQYKRCGKPGCRCAWAELHGPYWYRVWREAGAYRKEYVRAAEVDMVRDACARAATERRRCAVRRRQFRIAARQAQTAWETTAPIERMLESLRRTRT